MCLSEKFMAAYVLPFPASGHGWSRRQHRCRSFLTAFVWGPDCKLLAQSQRIR